MRSWTLVTLGALGAVLALLVPVVAVASHLGQPSVPGRAALPPLLDDVEVVRSNEGCGSGSCYREVLLAPGPDETPADLLTRLDLTERCGAGSLLDRRRHCTGAMAHPDGVHVAVYASIG